MKIYIFHCVHDYQISSSSLFLNSNIVSKNVRFIIDESDYYNSVILLSDHFTNQRMVQLIRKRNILTPIYIVSPFFVSINGINGVIRPEELSYNYIKNLYKQYPQKHIWSYAFNIDQHRRELSLT